MRAVFEVSIPTTNQAGDAKMVFTRAYPKLHFEWVPHTMREALAEGLTVLELPANDLQNLEDMVIDPAEYEIPENMLEKLLTNVKDWHLDSQPPMFQTSESSSLIEPSAKIVNEPGEGLKDSHPPSRPKRRKHLNSKETVEHPSKVLKSTEDKSSQTGTEDRASQTGTEKSSDLFYSHLEKNHLEMVESANSGYSHDISDLCDILTPINPKEITHRNSPELPCNMPLHSSKIRSELQCDSFTAGFKEWFHSADKSSLDAAIAENQEPVNRPRGRMEAVAAPRLEVDLNPDRHYQTTGLVSLKSLDTRREKHSAEVNHESSCSRENLGSYRKPSHDLRTTNKATPLFSVKLIDRSKTGNKKEIPGQNLKTKSCLFEVNNDTHTSNKRPEGSVWGASSSAMKTPGASAVTVHCHRRSRNPQTLAFCSQATQPAIALHSPVVLDSIATPVHSLTSHQPPKPETFTDLKESKDRTGEPLRRRLSQVKIPKSDLDWCFSYLNGLK